MDPSASASPRARRRARGARGVLSLWVQGRPGSWWCLVLTLTGSRHSEILHGEGRHHAAVDDGGPERLVGEVSHARERAEDPAREGISGAGWIDHALDRH